MKRRPQCSWEKRERTGKRASWEKKRGIDKRFLTNVSRRKKKSPVRRKGRKKGKHGGNPSEGRGKGVLIFSATKAEGAGRENAAHLPEKKGGGGGGGDSFRVRKRKIFHFGRTWGVFEKGRKEKAKKSSTAARRGEKKNEGGSD